jgi:hypothetical protein
MHWHGPSCLEGPFARKRVISGQPKTFAVSAVKSKSARSRRPNLRQDLIARVKREIAKGTYDTNEKLEAALDQLFQQFHTAE